MSKKTNQKNKNLVADTPATNVNVTVNNTTEDKELVMTAKITTETKKEKAYSSTTVLINNSQNFICLADGPEKQLTLAPREIKKVSKDLIKELLKNPMVRRFFDKGVVSHNTKDEKRVSAHEAVAPERLSQAVERYESGNNVVAEVKKFQKEGALNINL